MKFNNHEDSSFLQYFKRIILFKDFNNILNLSNNLIINKPASAVLYKAYIGKYNNGDLIK